MYLKTARLVKCKRRRLLKPSEAEDAEVIEVSGTVADPQEKRRNELQLIAAMNTLKPKQRLAAIAKAYMEDKIGAGTMSYMLVELLPFDPSGRFKIESMIREKYAELHPSLSDFEPAVEQSQMRKALKDRTI
jgi:hypothetical protein